MPGLIWAIATAAIPLELLPARIAGPFAALAAPRAAARPLGTVVLVLYGLGAAVFAATLSVGLLTGVRMCRRARKMPAHWDSALDARISADIQSPVSFGSIILLPPCSAAWDPRMVHAVLAHEREHVRHHDCYRLWLATLCRAVFWFNPLIHWLHRRLAILIELTSDEAAIAAIADHGDRAAYAGILL
jgi:beta-lactamase regulating signal transducer with metallopeptidase domain